MGISYSEAMQMTIREIKSVAKGKNKARVTSINDRLYISHTEAILSALASNGSKSFPKDAPKIEIKEDKPKTDEEKMQAMHDLARSICGSIRR